MYRINSFIAVLQLRLTPKAPESKNEAIAIKNGIKLQFDQHISTDHNGKKPKKCKECNVVIAT